MNDFSPNSSKLFRKFVIRATEKLSKVCPGIFTKSLNKSHLYHWHLLVNWLTVCRKWLLWLLPVFESPIPQRLRWSSIFSSQQCLRTHHGIVLFYKPASSALLLLFYFPPLRRRLELLSSLFMDNWQPPESKVIISHKRWMMITSVTDKVPDASEITGTTCCCCVVSCYI